MIATLIHLLVVLLLLVIVYYILNLAAGFFGAPAPVMQIVGLILLLIFLLYVVRALGIAEPLWRGGG